MEYDLIATLGPASRGETTWKKMLDAGATGFRLNTSHLTLGQLLSWLDRLNPFLATHASTPRLILDLQGSKWRLGDFDSFNLIEGQPIELIQANATRRPGVLPVPHPDFFLAAPLSNGAILLNDAKVHLVLEEIRQDWLRTRVGRGGEISPRKGITFAASAYRKESLNAQDEAILEKTRGVPSIHYAISYVKDAVEMSRYRDLFRGAWLIAKLERQSAVEQARLIAESAHELWLCRGDLGAELGLPGMAKTVHRFSSRLSELSIPVLLAGQIFEHMTGQPAPTRSEICCLYDALINGYRGVVLSDETAIGRYPDESCQTAAMFKRES